MPPVDNAALLAEDEAYALQHGNGKLRSGIVTPLGYVGMSNPATMHVIPGVGALWAVAVTSPGAEGLRLHFAGVDLPAGAELWIYAPGRNEYLEGPLGERGVAGTGDFWTAVLPGDLVYVEYLLPASAAGTGFFAVADVGHLYRPWFAPAVPAEPREGACHNDVMCYSAWHPLHNATARIAYVQGGFQYYCSATLLATQALDETPYVLTANHCVSTQTVAQTVTGLWRFQRLSCGGALSGGTTSQYFDFLFTDSVPDITLLMAKGILPSGLTWAEWDRLVVSLNAPVVGIHHPDAAYKRISFGTRIVHPFGDPTNYMGISWTSGTIEGGSSGSGAYRADPADPNYRKLVGVASHSEQPIGCANPDGPSGYGLMRQFYDRNATVRTLLAAGSDDTYEPNNTCAQAIAMATGTYSNLIVKSTAEDWFKFTLATNAALNVTASFTHVYGDINLRLYQSCGGAVVASSTSQTNQEQIVYTNTGAPAEFFLQVYLSAGNRNSYTMQVQVECPLPAWPTGVSATWGLCDFVRVSWNASSGATGYKVFRNTVNDPNTATQVGTPPASPFEDTTAAPGVSYYYWVKASNVCGDSQFSQSASGVRGALPAAPSGVSASDGTFCRKVQVSWNSVSGATSYQIWRHTTNDPGAAGMIGTASASPFDDLTMVVGQVYYYWVKSVGACGASDFSASDPGRATCALGDLNCDGALNTFDIDAFVLALTNPAGYAAAYPNCNRNLADCNGDGQVNSFDIGPFVALIGG